MISFRKPMRKLEIINDHMEWQIGYRERLLKAIEECENVSPSSKFFESGKYVTTCPDCFCPNMTSFYSESYNRKGFHCPACGNTFEMEVYK